ncbi:MAG TPA: DASS family sodium-coupled anion symporter [Dermatophilaceae bacterium]|nr:DASS family sodium-coupled anion symporter [Dermatophilaceae bacterium]
MSEQLGQGNTYRTLDEQREVLTPAEQRFERGRQTIGLFLGPAAFLLMFLLPLPLPNNQQALAAIFVFVIIFWLTEAIPIPVTAILALALCVILQVPETKEGQTASSVVFGAFTSSTIFLFLGAFIIARSMTRHGLDRRFALFVLSLPGIGKSTYGVIIGFGLIALSHGFVGISNTATTAMLLPIGLGMMGTLGRFVSEQSGTNKEPSRLKFGTALMLMIAYGASVGGLTTPIGSPPNLIGLGFIERQTGITISFFEWVLIALPIVLIMFVALCFILIALNKPEIRRISGVEEYVAQERSKLGTFSPGERNTLIVFCVAVFLWFLPGFVSMVAGKDAPTAEWLTTRLDEGAVAIVAASLLFFLPTSWRDRRFTLNWNEAAQIDWGTILLFGSGITLGTLLSSTGLAKTIGNNVAEGLGVTSLLAITILATVVAILISETTSNTASVGIVVPIIIPIAVAAGVNPVVPALAATFGASYGFMLPVSTPPNAIVYGSGMVPITKMVRSGVVFDVIGAILIVTGVTLMVQVVGLA